MSQWRKKKILMDIKIEENLKKIKVYIIEHTIYLVSCKYKVLEMSILILSFAKCNYKVQTQCLPERVILCFDLCRSLRKFGYVIFFRDLLDTSLDSPFHDYNT